IDRFRRGLTARRPSGRARASSVSQTGVPAATTSPRGSSPQAPSQPSARGRPRSSRRRMMGRAPGGRRAGRPDGGGVPRPRSPSAGWRRRLALAAALVAGLTACAPALPGGTGGPDALYVLSAEERTVTLLDPAGGPATALSLPPGPPPHRLTPGPA